MTPQEFLFKKLDIDEEGMDQYLYDFACSGELSEKIEKWMIKYAKLMCKKQKEICAEEAETKDDSPSLSYECYYVIDKDSILNSPFPKELQ